MNALSSAGLDPRIWILLHLHGVDRARANVVEAPTLESFKAFCQKLRNAKLRFRNYDRQEPGAFDDGAAQLIEWTDEVLRRFPAKDDKSLHLVCTGIQQHRDRLSEHLQLAAADREVIAG
jgi:hypothetical protein